MDLNKINNIYFLGAGGIGMSGLAQYFKAIGKTVSGYDKTPTDLTNKLITQGIPVYYSDDPELIPPNIELVVLTPAIPDSHRGLQYFIKQGIPVFKRAEILGMISNNMFTVAVAGTHGKTSTTSMISHILSSSGKKINAFVGGIMVNTGKNYILTKNADIIVAEADEYDRSFLKLFPDIAVITAIDPDHLDIYGDFDTLKNTFSQFAGQIKKGGSLIYKYGLPSILKNNNINSNTYSLEQGNYRSENIKIKEQQFHFDISGEVNIKGIISGVPGKYNIENAIAAIAVCKKLGVTDNEIREALKSYKGVERRFQIRINTNAIKYIDDYAHHPAEIEACLNTARELFPGKHIKAIFQPHLFSRTRDLAEGFADILSRFDSLALMEIYPARELPIEGINSKMLYDKINLKNKILLQDNKFIPALDDKDYDVLITIGAGDIGQLTGDIEKYLLEKIKNI